MLKILRIVFIAFLMVCFLVSCRSKKKDIKTVLKTTQPPPPVAKKMPEPQKSDGSYEAQLKQKLGLSSRELRTNKLYSFVLEWYGVPYRYGGCQKSGVDCSCFAGVLCEQVYGYSLPRRAEDIFHGCKQLSIKDARQGDLVFFTIGGGRKITHVGIYLDKQLFVHASTSKGVMVNSLEEAYYKKYFFSAGRMKDA